MMVIIVVTLVSGLEMPRRVLDSGVPGTSVRRRVQRASLRDWATAVDRGIRSAARVGWACAACSVHTHAKFADSDPAQAAALDGLGTIARATPTAELTREG